MKISGAEIVVETLIAQGTDTIFGFPGGAVIPIYDALYDRTDQIHHVLTAHEQGAGHAADGYARVTRKTGVCIATSGPGATNLVTAIATAYMDSTPMVAITGNVPANLLGKDSFQEVDIMGVTMPITKHNYQVTDVAKIERTLQEAFLIANSGRPGPVLVDITKDALTDTYVHGKKLPKKRIAELRETMGVEEKDPKKEKSIKEAIDTAVQMIRSSKKPAIYAGGGIVTSGAQQDLLEFVEKTCAPVSCSLMGIGSFPVEHALFAGMVGMHGTKTSNMAFTECDLLVVLGARFSDRVTGKADMFARGAKVLHVDIDLAEVNKNISAHHHINDDVKRVLSEINRQLEPLQHDAWMDRVKAWKKEDETRLTEAHLPRSILSGMRRCFDEPAVVVTDVGQHQMWTAQYYTFQTGDMFVTSGGLGTMGFGLGAAIGAKTGGKDHRVILVTGDGSFRMNLNELATVARFEIPVIIVLMDNNALGMVRQWQGLFFDKRYSQTSMPDVDFCAIAKAYGIDGYRIDNKEAFFEAFEKAVSVNRPALIHCKIHPDTMVSPMVPPGQAINSMMMPKSLV